MDTSDFRKYGHQLIDWIADYRERVRDLPVMARTRPGAIKAALPASPPAHGESFDAVLRDLDAIVVPGLSHWTHPSFFGYFPCNGDLSSVLGDVASTGHADEDVGKLWVVPVSQFVRMRTRQTGVEAL